MQWLLRGYLRWLARIILLYKKPYIIWVTGTVGKTTIAASIVQYLQGEFGEHAVMYSKYHYNGEYWLPLTVIGARTGGKNPFLWLWVTITAFSRLFRPYPRFLVAEYGIDHIGEMHFLRSIARPDVLIVTPIVSNHLEQFWTLEVYRQEKLGLLQDVPHILAHESLRSFVSEKGMFYGSNSESDIFLSDVILSLQGTDAVAHMGTKSYSFTVPALWKYQAENMLPLYFIGDILQCSLEWVANAIQYISPESGRSRLIFGKYNAIIIDGSYNASYASIYEWLISLIDIVWDYQLYVFLWDMRELGNASPQLHRRLAKEIVRLFKHRRDTFFFLVWPEMHSYVAPILREYFLVETSMSSRAWGKRLENLIKSSTRKSLVYAKWSQNTIFLEEGLKYLLDVSQHDLLCRNSVTWHKKKEQFFSKIS